MKRTIAYVLKVEQIEYIKEQAKQLGNASASAGLRFILNEHRRMTAEKRNIVAFAACPSVAMGEEVE